MKRKLKKVIACIVALTMTAALAACSGSNGGGEKQTESADSGDQTAQINLLSHRYAALEYYAQAMVDDVSG